MFHLQQPTFTIPRLNLQLKQRLLLWNNHLTCGPTSLRQSPTSAAHVTTSRRVASAPSGSASQVAPARLRRIRRSASSQPDPGAEAGAICWAYHTRQRGECIVFEFTADTFSISRSIFCVVCFFFFRAILSPPLSLCQTSSFYLLFFQLTSSAISNTYLFSVSSAVQTPTFHSVPLSSSWIRSMCVTHLRSAPPSTHNPPNQQNNKNKKTTLRIIQINII